jgi:hypothetical protein
MSKNICEVTEEELLKFWTEIFRDENQNTEYRLEASIQLARYLGMFSENRTNFNIE